MIYLHYVAVTKVSLIEEVDCKCPPIGTEKLRRVWQCLVKTVLYFLIYTPLCGD